MTVATETTETGRAPRRGMSRAVLWVGVMLGTAMAILAMTDGARLHIGGSSVPGWIQAALGALVLWLIVVAVSTVAADLVRRHHKTAARWSWGHARRGGGAAGRRARWHGARFGAAAAGWAANRWQSRVGGRLYARTPDATAPDARPSRRVDARPETEADTRFFDLRGSGYDGPIDQDGRPVSPAGSTPTEGNTVTDLSKIPPPPAHPSQLTDDSPWTYDHGAYVLKSDLAARGPRPRRRAQRAAARATGKLTAAWSQVIGGVTDFEPEDDGELLDWMADEVAGMAAYAESLVEQYESCLKLGLDPVAMSAMHDTADACASAAEAMAAARRKFADHYDQPREFAAQGGLMPHDGRWVTGEGDA